MSDNMNKNTSNDISNSSKLGLGTVQFGCDYGVSNKSGQVLESEVLDILNYAKQNGINVLDTAQGYGESEKVLGKFDLSEFKIITKTMGVGKLETSLENLDIESVYGLMFHRGNEINDKSWARFEDYKSQKMVEKIGVSVYLPSELEELIEKYPIDIVQLPLNLLDQRFLPILPKLKEKNIEIHTRSAFMQGLLLMDSKDVNSYFDSIKPILEKLPQDGIENRLAAALGFVNSIKEVDRIIVGTTSVSELKQIVSALDKNNVPKNIKSFIIEDEKFILPQNWKLEKN